MIDLEKERESFEEWALNFELDIKVVDFSGSIKCKDANGEQVEFCYNDAETELAWYSWKRRAELAQAEINELKQKLARYKNPDYVLVPREPTEKMIWFGESGIAVCQKIKAKDVYKDMLEAVENENVPENS